MFVGLATEVRIESCNKRARKMNCKFRNLTNFLTNLYGFSVFVVCNCEAIYILEKNHQGIIILQDVHGLIIIFSYSDFFLGNEFHRQHPID